MKTKTAKTAKTTTTPVTPANPYREGGNYHKLFAFLLAQKGKPFARDAVMEYAKGLKDRNGKPLNETAATASVVVIMSPRKEGESRGDCRGNLASMGHLYYLARLKGKDGGKVYSLHWRATPLEPATRAAPAKEAKRTAPAKGKGKEAKVKPTKGKETKGKGKPTKPAKR